jgi:hypothetical protein
MIELLRRQVGQNANDQLHDARIDLRPPTT